MTLAGESAEEECQAGAYECSTMADETQKDRDARMSIYMSTRIW